MPELTAYFGLMKICKLQKGETVVVFIAVGAIGIVVGQVVKIVVCRVIGITGFDEKATILKKGLGFDEAINYKTPKGISVDIANI